MARTGGLKADWHIADDELVQTALKGDAWLVFGDPAWIDYTFSADVKIVESTGHAGLIFRDGGEQTPGRYSFNGGLRGVYGGAIASSATGNIPARRTGNTTLTCGQWNNMKITVQGNRLAAYLDDRVVMVAADAFKARGAVGFYTTNSICRFRNLKVTAPNRQALWQGLPELPTVSSFGVSLRPSNQ